MHRPKTTARLLMHLRNADGIISGEQLSRNLGVSRTAVWKQVSLLRSEGYRIDAVPSQGYYLSGEPDQLDNGFIRAELESDCIIGCKIVCTGETGSTNTDAFLLAEQGACEGTVLIADRQTRGKGRLGRYWVSPGGINLYCSVILRPCIPPFEAPQLTFISAVAVARAVKMTTGIQPEIKWPNDLLLNGRKFAGLLNEMSAETDRVSFVILGIGVNINMQAEQFPADLRTPATSLLLETGRPIMRQKFIVCLLKQLDAEYARFLQYGFAPVREEWEGYCNASGREVLVDLGATRLQGKFAGLDYDGALLLRMPDNRNERILSGDVTIL